MNNCLPECAILMATYNGERWLSEQLDSLCEQQGVSVRVIVSDDQSTDETVRILKSRALSLSLTILSAQSEPFGCANKNFLRLFRDADIGGAEYVALADQDDVWSPNKLVHAVRRLESEEAAAYSSDFEAFWADGRTQMVRKSHPQKQFDYLFGSPGPGCTFVFTRAVYLEIRTWVTANYDLLSHLWVHDWILYAYVRSRNHRWLIDDTPTLRYRQHESNEIGVNYGIKAIHRRLVEVKKGLYRNNIVAISEITNAKPEFVRALRRLSWSDRFWLIIHANQFRRSLRDVWALRLIFILMPATPVPRYR